VESSDDGLEEQRVTAAPIGQEKRVERRGHREDKVEVGNWENVLLLRLDPACLFQTLTLGAMPVPTRIVEGLLATTVVADLEVAAQKRRSTRHDVSDYSTTLAPEFLGRWRMRSEDFRQIGRAALSGRQGLPRPTLPQGVQRTSRLLQIVACHVSVALRRLQTAMTQ
jgi:hypothetical protein